MQAFHQVYLGTDHAGFQLKEAIKTHLSSLQIPCEDLGCYSEDAVDYPDIAYKVSEKVVQSKTSCGILVCGSGVGVSIAANRYPEIRASLCHDVLIAKLSREHNNANVICLGGRISAVPYALEMVDIFLNTAYEGERHDTRVNKLSLSKHPI